MSDAVRNPDNYCYRHPDRMSFIICQRCGRTICTDCQTPAAVGVHCPECVKEARQSMPRVRRASSGGPSRQWARVVGTGTPATYSILAIMVAVFVLQFVTGLTTGPVTNALAFFAPRVTGQFQPWTLLTAPFVHVSVIQLLFDLLSVWLIGRILEPLLGHWRYVFLFLLCNAGGIIANEYFGYYYVGASAATLGMLVALLVISRHLGANNVGLAVIIGINIVYSFIFARGSIPGYIGGMAIGAVLAFIFTRTRARSDFRRQVELLGGLGAALVVVFVAGAFVAL